MKKEEKRKERFIYLRFRLKTKKTFPPNPRFEERDSLRLHIFRFSALGRRRRGGEKE